MTPNLLRASLELAEQHFCHILVVRMSQKPGPGSRGGAVASTLDWSRRRGELLDAIVADDPPHPMWLGPPFLSGYFSFYLNQFLKP